jgi:hypothetical protein
MEKTDLVIIRGLYEKLERLVLILIAIPIPFFAVVYLDAQNGLLFSDVPQIPNFLENVLFTAILVLLGLQYLSFQHQLKNILNSNLDLIGKIHRYIKATAQRFWILMFSSLLCAVGLLFFHHPLFTLLFAIGLVFFSLGKPSPDRIIRMMKLKAEEKEMIHELKRRI